MQSKQSRRLIKKEDRISSLPDCLLVDIVSRLPCTKQAIRTGILSNRWKNLWTEVHNLIFIHHSEERVLEFFSYIEDVLRQRGQLDLNKFQLDIPYDAGIDKQVNNWIRYAFSCNVKYLDLELVSDNEFRQSEFVLDQFFFINSSATRMNLKGCLIKPTGAISWTKLKSLHIGGDLTEDNFQDISSGSPLLETLTLENCQGFFGIDITSRSVKNLVVDGYRDWWEYNATEVEINAPHILSLTIEGELSQYLSKVVLLNVSSLVEAELNYYSNYNTRLDEEEEEEMLKGLILSLRHVKMLHIGDNCQETLDRLEAKGFTFPSNMEYPDYDSSKSEKSPDNDSTESGY